MLKAFSFFFLFWEVLLYLFKIKFTGVTLVNKVIWVSGCTLSWYMIYIKAFFQKFAFDIFPLHIHICTFIYKCFVKTVNFLSSFISYQEDAKYKIKFMKKDVRKPCFSWLINPEGRPICIWLKLKKHCDSLMNW